MGIKLIVGLGSHDLVYLCCLWYRCWIRFSSPVSDDSFFELWLATKRPSDVTTSDAACRTTPERPCPRSCWTYVQTCFSEFITVVRGLCAPQLLWLQADTRSLNLESFVHIKAGSSRHEWRLETVTALHVTLPSFPFIYLFRTTISFIRDLNALRNCLMIAVLVKQNILSSVAITENLHACVIHTHVQACIYTCRQTDRRLCGVCLLLSEVLYDIMIP